MSWCCGITEDRRACRNRVVTYVPPAGGEFERSIYVHSGYRCRKHADEAARRVLSAYAQREWAREWVERDGAAPPAAVED